MIDVPAGEGLTRARRLSEIRDMAFSLIAITEDVTASQVGVNVVAMIVDGIDLMERRRQIDAEREAAHDAERKAAVLTVDLLRKLNADHVHLRTSAKRLGCRSSEPTNCSKPESSYVGVRKAVMAFQMLSEDGLDPGPSDANHLGFADALQWVIVGVLRDDRQIVGYRHCGNPQVVHVDPATFLGQSDSQSGPMSGGNDVDGQRFQPRD